MSELKNKSIRRELVKAAKTLFSQKSFSAVTIREIANLADTNSACISYYFGDKLGLYKIILEEELARAWEKMRKIDVQNMTPEKRLIAQLEAIFKNRREDPESQQMLQKTLLNETDENVIKLVDTIYVAPLMRHLASMIDQCELRSGMDYIDKEEIIFFVIGMPAYWGTYIKGFNNFFKGSEEENVERANAACMKWLKHILKED